MQQPRPTPFELVFDSIAPTTFPAVQAAVAASGRDARDRDGFLLLRDVLMLLRELRPEEGLGEGIDQLAALVHHAYLFWSSGGMTVEVPAELLEELLRHQNSTQPLGELPARYVQLPQRRIWAQVVSGEPHEPLDGFFHHEMPGGEQRVLGVFGMHPDRPGFSVVEVSGVRSPALTRADGSPLFAPTLPGGAAAGLYSIAGEEELLELGWRVQLALRNSPLLAPSS
jgi:hypothetical protein